MRIVSGVAVSALVASVSAVWCPTDLAASGATVRSSQRVASVSFASPINYAAGATPNDVVAGDLDKDGDADLVVANKDSGTVSVLEGEGDGTVSAPVAYSVSPGQVESVTLANLDSDVDSDLDVVAMNPDDFQTDDVAVLPGAEGATFGPAVDFVGDSDQDGFFEYQPTVATGDFNQDGDPDLALGSANFRNLTVLIGQAGIQFGSPTDIPLDNGSQGMTPVVADFDQDGDPDLAVERADRVSILLGGVGATFGDPTDYPLGYSAGTIVASDLDADGDPDLATVGRDPGSVSVLMGGPGGTFADPTTFASGGNYSADVAAGDVNGDEVVDLVVANTGFTDTGGITVHLGLGDGTFEAPQSFDASPRPQAVTLSDLDRDTDLDVVVANRGGGEFYPDQLSVLENVTIAADTSPPDTSILSGPDDGSFVLAEEATFEIGATEADSTIACTLDGTPLGCADELVEMTHLTHRTHVVTAVATDAAGNTDPEAATRSWTIPLDDTQLAADRPWRRTKASGGYLAGASEADRKGATLSKKVSGARQLALVVTKAPRYGKVKVLAGKQRLATVSLAATARRTHRMVVLPALHEPFSGTVRIVVATAGKTVRIEGLGVSS